MSTTSNNAVYSVAGEKLLVPRQLNIAGSNLVWPSPGATALQEPKPKLLDEFIVLSERVDDESILEFAKSWGVLGLCEHRLSEVRAARTPGFPPQGTSPCGCRVGPAGHGGAEPLAAWKAVATRAHACFKLATHLRSRRLGSAADWRDLIGERGAATLASRPRDASELATRVHLEWELLTKVVNEWLTVADIRPRLAWNTARPVVRLFPNRQHGVFPALACLLMARVCDPRGLLICSECDTLYPPKERGEHLGSLRNRCGRPECERVVARRASARYRANKKNGVRIRAPKRRPDSTLEGQDVADL